MSPSERKRFGEPTIGLQHYKFEELDYRDSLIGADFCMIYALYGCNVYISTIDKFFIVMRMRPLSETDSYVLFQDQEAVFLFDKDVNREIWRMDIYGNAKCGLIGISNEWVVVGAENLHIWKQDTLKTVVDEELRWIHKVRQVGANELELLTDPWTDTSSIWLYDVMKESKLKIRDFPDYRLKEFTEDVLW